MIGKSYFLLLLLQAGLAQEWKVHTPGEVMVHKGSCAQIPCHYTYPSHLTNQPRIGIWFNNENGETSSTAFHSKDHSHELARFRHRTWLSGDLKDGDCSLIIKDITLEDAGPYYFRIEFDNVNSYNYFPVTRLQVSAGLSQEWKHGTPQEVTVQEGSCAQIPCHYNYPSCLENEPRNGVWFNSENLKPWAPIAFHSKDHNHELPRLHNRTRLSGNLKDGNCSLIITNIRREDAGPYFFRVEFENGPSFNYYPATQLHVSNFTDKPMIVPEEIIAGKQVNLSCTFNTTCIRVTPVLTWDTHGSVSNTVTQHGVTLTYTSVLSLTPSLRHQGQTLTCKLSYPTFSSEETLTLTVQYSPRNLSITSPAVIKASSINIIEGKSAVIICSVESFPASNLTWRRLNVIMNRTSSNNELWLEISSITCMEMGDYQCVAENEHGIMEGSLTIVVECRDFREWKAGFLAAGITLSIGLSGFFIYKCVRKMRTTGRDHSAHTKNVSRNTPGEQSDRSREGRMMKQETKARRCTHEYQGITSENCESQKRKVEEMKTNHHINANQDNDIYANWNFQEEAVYGNI
ncbi:sialic acid-binding Ig-like lectin 13 [Chiloscyllium punctatum]|uniref:sialic acid-binding Ig-like lectin 13 n=1 Tax=Chiloscyllium punctatum TaxID=137246 RepID=UPI003B6396E2